jgi:hypothetical protein
MLPGKGCVGIGAVTTGVLIPERSQLRQAYLKRAFCRPLPSPQYEVAW